MTSPVKLTIVKMAGLVDPFEQNNAAKISAASNQLGFHWTFQLLFLYLSKKSSKTPNLTLGMIGQNSPWTWTSKNELCTISDMAYQNALLELQVPS